MAIPMYSRHNRPPSPRDGASSAVTPARVNHTRTMSPPTNSSYSPTVTSGGQSRPNIVNRVAIEGKAKQGQDGASIRMYLKIALPLDNVTPGSTIPLFPEENIKILTSQVHPTDNNSVPYNFSSTVSPLLHNAARALNLPARSSETYHAAFGLSLPPNTSSIVSSSHSSVTNGFSRANSESVPPIDGQYTGHILVSGYHISYVLPKVFPPRLKASGSPTYTEADSHLRMSSRNRRPSVSGKDSLQFMAAIDMWVPFLSRPPRSPFLLSIPIPRCLHNNIKLRIFPPTSTSASFASLSSVDEDGGSWDLTSDPHVTRSSTHRPSRTSSYTHFADDESSDSSTAGFSDGCGIQGTFPSAERIRVRWAKPLKIIDVPVGGCDGRRRVGVKEVKGEMTCIVRGKMKDNNGSEGVLMNVEYKGSCKGIWFPGVATLLGMDVGLEAKGSDVSWVEGSPNEWNVGGGVGYTGFDVGASLSAGTSSRAPLLDSNSPHIHISPSPDETTLGRAGAPAVSSRQTSTSSTTSLLRAPLPLQNVADYSFEGSAATMASSSSAMGTVSSISSLQASAYNLPPQARPAGVPITLHVNMNEILPPSKNSFIFSIAGTILVTPRPNLGRTSAQGMNSIKSSHIRPGDSDTDADLDPIVLPRFTVLAADSETTSIVVRNEVDGENFTVEVYNSTGDIYRDAQARKTVLQKGAFTKCGEDGGRIALKTIGGPLSNGPLMTPGRPRMPNGVALSRVPSNSSLGRMIFPVRPKRDGPLMIPSVLATVTPLVQEGELFPCGYAIRVTLNAPADADTEWLEFGLAQQNPSSSLIAFGSSEGRPPRVDIASASIEGIPVRFEASASAGLDEAGTTGLPFEEMSGKDWVTWVRVHVGAVGGGVVVVDYVVRENGVSTEESRKGKGKTKDELLLSVFLPTFSIPVGRLEVVFDDIPGVDVSSLRSNFTYQQTRGSGQRLLHYSVEEFFYPHLVFTLRPGSSRSTTSSSAKPLALLTWAMLLAGFIFIHHLSIEVRKMGHSLETYSIETGSGWNDVPDPVTVTTTVYNSIGTEICSREPLTETLTISLVESRLVIPTLTAPVTNPAIDAMVPTTTGDEMPPLIPSPIPDAIEDLSVLPTFYSDRLYDLISGPIREFLSSTWPTQDEHALRVLEQVKRTMEVVWQTFRKIYHYPLDPI